MAEIGVRRILLLIISLTKCLEGTKLLADLKKCGDLECESLISRVLAMRDYTGPDCLYLNFTKGEEISVYVKLAGEREDLWAGSKGKDFGFFPRDAVQVEEVFISEEVEISTKESDFLCLLGVSYIFENEDSELKTDSDENMYPYKEEQNYGVYENNFQIESGFYATSESIWFEGQFPASEAPEDIRSDWEKAEAGHVEQDHIPEVDQVLPPLTVPEVQGWFGFGKKHAEEKALESVIETVQESSFQSRKIAVEDENDLEELSNSDPQTEHQPELESEFDSVPEEKSELALESEHTLKPQATAWFGGRFTSYLGFPEEDTNLELLSKESNSPLQDVPSFISSAEEATVPYTEIVTEKEDTVTNDSTVLKPSWFDFGFGMLGFAYANEDKIIPDDGKTEEDEDKIISDDGKNEEDEDKITSDGGKLEEDEDKITSDDGKIEEDSGVDKHKHPLASEFDPNNEQEVKMMKTLETEEQIDKERILEKTDNSNTIPYLKKLWYNFNNPWSSQNIPKETELPFPKQIPEQNNMVENNEGEEFSGENHLTDHMKDLMMLKNRYTQSDTVSHEEVLFETSSSKNNHEKSKSSVESEGPTQVETDKSAENTLLNSQMFSTDNSLSSQNYIPPNEGDTAFQILQYLFQFDVNEFMNSAFLLVVILTERLVILENHSLGKECVLKL